MAVYCQSSSNWVLAGNTGQIKMASKGVDDRSSYANDPGLVSSRAGTPILTEAHTGSYLYAKRYKGKILSHLYL